MTILEYPKDLDDLIKNLIDGFNDETDDRATILKLRFETDINLVRTMYYHRGLADGMQREKERKTLLTVVGNDAA